MRGSAVFRTGVAPGAALAPRWTQNVLWRSAKAVPSLDLRFAESKSLTDAASGQSLVTFTRASSGTYVDSQGVIRTATTNEARFDHNPTTGESLGLLVEESRTNLCLQSEDLSTTWTVTRATVSTNAVAAPSGSTVADKLVEDTTATNTHFVQQSIAVTTGTAYTFSIYAKAAERNYAQLVLNGQFAAVISAIFDLSTGAVGTTTGSPATSAVLLPNGWWRLSITATTNATGATLAQVRVSNSSTTATYTGDGTSGIYLWGAQLEAGAFFTSYIPTTTATATRSADVASISGSNFSSWYRQDEGTVFAEIDRSIAITSASTAVSINDNSLSNRLFNFRQDSASQLTVVSVTAGGVDGSPQVSLISTSAKNKIAAAQATNNLAVSANGGALLADTSVAMPTVNQMQIGNVNNTSVYNGTIRRLTYWPQRLPNSTLQAITQ